MSYKRKSGSGQIFLDRWEPKIKQMNDAINDRMIPHTLNKESDGMVAVLYAAVYKNYHVLTWCDSVG